MEQLILPLLVALLFLPLLLSFRRQRRQLSQMQQLQSSLGPGDRVMTTSGLHGTVVGTTDETVDLEIAPGVVTTWVRQAVRDRLTEPEEATATAATTEDNVVADEADRR